MTRIAAGTMRSDGTDPAPAMSRFGLLPMRPRDPAEPHRSASPLELFFDLVFVVSIAIASSNLHHFESEGRIVDGIGPYLMIFFAIWWAWMNHTWFATSFDTDDWLYRIATILQMGGALLVAAGAEAAMVEGDFGLTILGYIVMRLVMVGQWLRAAAGSVEHRSTSLRYGGGITVVQALWVVWWLAAPEGARIPGFVVLVLAELAVPIWAARSAATPSHPHHITERYGLFTIILLGESILASSNAIIDALHHSEQIGSLVTIAVTGLALAAGMWWVYFSRSQHDHLATRLGSASFAYVHYVIFAAAGAFSAGIEVAIDYDTHRTDLDGIVSAATTTVPVSLFVLGIWLLALRGSLPAWANAVVPILAVAIGLTALAPYSLVVAAIAMVAIVVVLETTRPAVRR